MRSSPDAAPIIESIWNHHDFGLVLGEVKFVDGMTDLSGNRVALRLLPLYRAFAQKGFISLSDERDLTSNFGGWDDWFQLSQAGVRRTAKVVLTDAGRAAGDLKESGSRQVLWVGLGRAEVSEIVADDSMNSGVDRYRIVMGLHTFDIPEDLRAAYQQAVDTLGQERRFKALLKYDPFEKQWRIEAADYSNRHDDFATHTVDDRTGVIRLCGPSGC